MAQLIAFIDSEKSKQNHVLKLMESNDWENIFLFSDDSISLKSSRKFDAFKYDKSLKSLAMADFFHSCLRGKLRGFDVGLNLICCDGKEHMAMVSAIIKLGMGIRLVVMTAEGMAEL